MTDQLRQAAQQALEALVKSTGELHRYYSSPTDMQILLNHKAITALKAALEQPEQEPDAQRFTEQQLRDYGSAEFERAVVLAMQATRPFGKVGDVIAVSIAHIERSEG